MRTLVLKWTKQYEYRKRSALKKKMKEKWLKKNVKFLRRYAIACFCLERLDDFALSHINTLFIIEHEELSRSIKRIALAGTRSQYTKRS
jgi:hypothetical protein